MRKAAVSQAKVRGRRRERQGVRFSFKEHILRKSVLAHRFLDIAPLTRVLIERGLCPVPGLRLEHVDAMVRLIKDALGLITLTDEEFESAVPLTVLPELWEFAASR
jgi:hypothetical protein